MGFRACVDRQDPFTRTVREVYRANVVRAPRTGIEPLDTLAVRKTAVQPRGRLATMIDGDPVDLPASRRDAVAALGGERSTALEVGLGVDLTTTFFAAIGIPVPSAKATASLWKGAHRLTFEVRDVTQHEVDLAELGRALDGRRLVRNPATDVFFVDDRTRLLVITRTLTSACFAVRAVAEAGQSVDLQVDALADVLGEASARVAWSAEGDSTVSFRGRRPATFAFACVPCAVAADRTVVFGLESQATLGQPAAPVPTMRPVIDEPGLLALDPDDGGR